MSQDAKRTFEILNPERQVPLVGGQEAIMRPLPLESAGALLEWYNRLVSLKAHEFTPLQMLAFAAHQGAPLIKACLHKLDDSADELVVQAADFVALAEIFVNQNIDGVLVGKLEALAARLDGILPKVEFPKVDQSKTSQSASNSLSQTDTGTGKTQAE
jgi:hypothetical protein